MLFQFIYIQEKIKPTFQGCVLWENSMYQNYILKKCVTFNIAVVQI